MAIYSIKDLEQLSGIKAHTLRIWEQRYKIITPGRTKTNIRYYTDEHLKCILNIAILNKNGVKISKIAEMNERQISAQVSKVSDVNFDIKNQLDALTISMVELDECVFDKIISTNIAQIGFERTMIEVINPFLEKLGNLWFTGSLTPIHEQFITNLIRQKIIAEIDKLCSYTCSSNEKFVIFLPEGEKQELSLLFFHFSLKIRKFSVVYLGNDVSLKDLKFVSQVHQPAYIFTIINTSPIASPLHQYVSDLTSTFPNSKLLLSGHAFSKYKKKMPANASVLQSFSETMDFLNLLSSSNKVKTKKVTRS